MQAPIIEVEHLTFRYDQRVRIGNLIRRFIND